MSNSLLNANHKEVLQSGGGRRHRLPLLAALFVFTAALLASAQLSATEAPGAPGVSSAWTSGAKEGLGTSTTLESKVWYTLGQGILNEVYYPQVDVPNVQDMQFIITDGSTFVDLERDDTNHQLQLVDPKALTYRQINTAKSGKYRITKTYVTDPGRSTLLIQTHFEALSGGPYQLYVLYNPSLNNSGMGDTAATSGNALVANDGNVASALMSSSGFTKMTSGYSGTSSDGLIDLRADKRLDGLFDSASASGNIVQTAQINVGNDTTFMLALGFGSSRDEAKTNATNSLATSFATQETNYENGWHSYLDSLPPAPRSVTQNNLTIQYNVALMTLKAHEDKTFRGANVASLTIPWGQAVNADICCPNGYGYHSVWARDLYEVSTAQLAAGDRDAANRSLDYLLNVQQRPDGSMPQNSRVDGSATNFTSLQMDEVAFPIVLAWQLGRTDATTWGKLKKSADFIVSRGPFTPQERWEEESGFSPSTIAAEIAGLVCAADIAQKNGDSASANTYLAKADDWQRNVENWTFTTTDPEGNHQHYIRIDDNTNPNDGDNLGINNGGGNFDERAIVDAGFLELVRLGVKPANDSKVAESLPEIDALIKVTTPSGDMFYRYNHDGYGEKDDGSPFQNTGIGRLWPIFSGERGEYELANGRSALSFLMTMAKAANDGFMIPEQVWDRSDGKGKFTFGKGTDSATPLAWSMAQFVRLAQSIDAGSPVETPLVVVCRYDTNHPRCLTGKITFNVTVPAVTPDNGPVFLAGELNKLDPSLPNWQPDGKSLNKSGSTWQGALPCKSGTTFNYKYTLGGWNSVEKGADCKELPNRVLTLTCDASGNQTVNDTVAAWASLPPCGGPRDVNVTFKVTVPVNAGATGRQVSIAGTLSKLQSSLPDWDPRRVPLSGSGTQWQWQITGKEGTQIEYKYTLGDWSLVEKTGNCGEVPNRKLTLSCGGGASCTQTVNDTVANWRNVPPCGN